MRDDRSMTPPPPRSPSPSYFAIAEQTPSRISEPSASRKLLVLDLNGTLLHRSAHMQRPKHRHNQPYEVRPRDEHGNWLPRLRPVHPRPYMRAFRSYLFAPQTQEWLDVMVWSSAQPHSVNDMVDKCFGEYKQKLVAMWARDTLGLSNDHYHRKVQTVKDLTKPWSFLASRGAEVSSSPHSSIASTPRSSPEPSSPSRPSDESEIITPQAHSALTTLLLDDSPRKAELQPFNHVCIGEYSGERRAKDLESLQKELEWNAAMDTRQQLDAQIAASQGSAGLDSASAPDETPETLMPEDIEESVPDAAVSGATQESLPSTSAADASKKRKRKGKKLQKRAALLDQLTAGRKPEVCYDETLLAVIGVLDEIKSQANVAAWIRSGGLWGPYDPPVVRSPQMKATAEDVEESQPTASTSSPIATAEAATQSDDSDLSVKDLPPEQDTAPAQDNDGKARKCKRKRQRMHSTGAQGTEASEVADVGNDEETVAPVTSTAAQDKVVDSAQKMWFEDPQVLSYWAARGRKALEELGIPVEHGIER
ncbi:NLI interacting factor-like phosphatase-domain-containing protein [Trametes punicea]|nr:NLI interacting factor-like phosphatase-domain-containing protein [Trametes punicea]